MTERSKARRPRLCVSEQCGDFFAYERTEFGLSVLAGHIERGLLRSKLDLSFDLLQRRELLSGHRPAHSRLRTAWRRRRPVTPSASSSAALFAAYQPVRELGGPDTMKAMKPRKGKLMFERQMPPRTRLTAGYPRNRQAAQVQQHEGQDHPLAGLVGLGRSRSRYSPSSSRRRAGRMVNAPSGRSSPGG